MRWSRRTFEAMQDFYRRTLAWSLDNPKTIMVDPADRGGAEFLSAGHRAQGLLPRCRTTARMQGGIRGDQSISFQSMQKKFHAVRRHHQEPIRRWRRWAALPAASATNTGNIFVTLKPPRRARHVTTDEVIDRLRPKLDNVAGARLFLQAGASRSAPAAARAMASYQYTIQGDTLDDCNDLGAQDHRRAAGRAGAGGRQFRPAGQGPGGRSEDRPRHRGAAGPQRQPRSTTRSMMPSASARSRPSTRTRTSIMW